VQRHALAHERAEPAVVQFVDPLGQGAGEQAEGLGAVGGHLFEQAEVEGAVAGGHARQVVGDRDGGDPGELTVLLRHRRDEATVGLRLGLADARADRGPVAVPGPQRGRVGT
jgi:hypothetical protein